MKFFGTIVAATTLFASGISALPLSDLGGIHRRAAADYDINKVLKDWIVDPSIQRKLANHCNTRGGWEGWAQGELETEFRSDFRIADTVREVTEVYAGKGLADFVLPKTKTNNGMVIELKCENAYGQPGVKIAKPVRDDIAKRAVVKPKYNDYTFVALAMVYTPNAETALRKIGMKAIPGAEASLPGSKKMKIYREDWKLKSLVDEIEDLDLAMYNLFLSNSRPSSPAPAPKPAAGKPAPKPAAGKAAPGKKTGPK
ncbi:hypothetical protein B5807_03983 [Epicoccum nigrum]|jgi:hypothetical protein|uniref:Required for respiratory growth protein 7, mitochondrial n=1 Tax=Epicoccum nigrum TaxID=105696 RepID=A0A1Y2M5J1_EPING|nr:hypothetical protein B5807_03983 [Epicoccum nigrum]